MNLNLDTLNSYQREAVLHLSGPLLILAGAGSGKTSTMAYRIAYLMAQHAVPGFSILGLSFTNKAARELRDRVLRLMTDQMHTKMTRGLTITTFHSLCAKLLRIHAPCLGFQKDFTILDRNDQVSILKQVLKNIHIDDHRFDPETILFHIGQAKNRFLNPEQTQSYFLESAQLTEDYGLAAAASFNRYQDQLRVLNSMDFDDLIYYTVQLLENHPSVRDQYNQQFKHILVDEYQDTNAAQFHILKLFTEKQQNLCVVGDDDQSIYAWRGADPSHILQFAKYYPGAHTIALEQNYRSTSRILEAANHMIAQNTNRYPKKLWSNRGDGELITEVILESDREEADFITEEILRATRTQVQTWKDFAILYRSHAQSRIFEESFRRRAIPYKIIGGLSFLARKEVKDVLAYWRLIVNLKDDASLRRIINWPARGIGKTSLETLGHEAFTREMPIFEIFETVTQLITPKAAEAVCQFQNLILELRNQLESLPGTAAVVSTWAKHCLQKVQAKKAIEAEYDDEPIQAAKKWENIDELLHSIGQFKLQTEDQDFTVTESSLPPLNGVQFLREFLNRMTLEAQDIEKEEKKDAEDSTQANQVTLLTLHGAKGLEYPIVFLVGVEDGFLPHQRTLDAETDLGEERRLCYVGMTRAKDRLYLTRTRTRIRYGKPVLRHPSRFLKDIPQTLLHTLNRARAPIVQAASASFNPSFRPFVLSDQRKQSAQASSSESKRVSDLELKKYFAEMRARLNRS